MLKYVVEIIDDETDEVIYKIQSGDAQIIANHLEEKARYLENEMRKKNKVAIPF